jgi:predicted transcriptional regulator of viral defense system
MPSNPPARPNWNQLFEKAAGQEGLFTTQQAADAGYSPQLLVHHIHAGRAVRVRRGIYRLVHFPAGEHEELVAAWLSPELLRQAAQQALNRGLVTKAELGAVKAALKPFGGLST